MDKTRIKTILTLIAVGGLFFLFFRQTDKPIAFVEDEKPLAAVINPFDNINLEAKAVYVFDIAANEPIFEFNSSVQLPLASLTKIMTAVVAEESMPEDEIRDLSNVFDSALVQSSNEAAIIIATEASKFIADGNFVDLMNREAKKLDLRQTYFLNETGLDFSENISGGYGSANDIAKLMVYAARNNPRLFEPTAYGKIYGAINTNICASSTINLIASKTGFTDLAGGNLAIIFDAGFNHPVVAAVLGSTKDGRFTDMQKIIEATFEYLRK